MKHLIKPLTLFLSFVLFYSCQNIEDPLIVDGTEKQSNIEFSNDRLVFSSESFLSQTINNAKKMTDAEVSNQLYPLYDKGFIPLIPKFKKEDSERYNEFAENKLSKLSSSGLKSLKTDEYSVDEDNLVSDDGFGSFLNEDREIQIGDIIYSYQPTGLYFANVINEKELKKVIKSAREKSTNSKLILDPCIQQESAGITYLGGGVSLYIAPIDDCGGTGGSGGGGGTGGGGGGTSPDPGIDYYTFAQNLNVCAARTGSLHLFGVFGTAQVCHSYFNNNDYRVKTKYYDENYLVYKAIGVKVKHQKKGWLGLWSTKTGDEVALGFNQVHLKYTLPSVTIPSNMYSNYIYFNNRIYSGQGQLLSSLYGTNLPITPFNSPVEIYVNISAFGISLDNPNIDLKSAMNSLFKNTLKGQVNNLLTQLGFEKPKKITVVGMAERTVIIDHYENISIKNIDKINEVFDWQAAIGVKLGVGENGGFTFQSLDLPSLYDYDDISIDFYGAARRGSEWKGSRIVYND